MRYLLLSVFLFCINTISFAQKEADLLGNWYSPNKDAKIYMYKGSNGKYYGKISWLKNPNGKNNLPQVDENNPDPARRKDPILGIVLFKDFVHKVDDGEHVWENGTVYDAESGKTYNCIMTLKGPKKLEVRGYIGFSFIGRSETFEKAE